MTALDKLNSFVSSNDAQLEQIIPFQLTTRKIITQILDSGILSQQELIERGFVFEPGYDADPSNVVFLNVITKLEGVRKAVLSPADGVFVVGMERIGDDQLIEGLIPQAKIDERFQEQLSSLSQSMSIPENMHSLIKEKIKKELIEENEHFLEIIQKRVFNTVVLILDVEVIPQDKLDDPSGCHDAVRLSVAEEKIKAIIASQELRDAAEISNIVSHQIKPIIFVKNVPMSITYVYKSHGNVQTLKSNILVPEFETALEKYFKENFSQGGKPMFIHATRI